MDTWARVSEIIVVTLGWMKLISVAQEITNLNTYPGVDPARHTGQQVMDAGRVTFAKRGRVLDWLARSCRFMSI